MLFRTTDVASFIADRTDNRRFVKSIHFLYCTVLEALVVAAEQHITATCGHPCLGSTFFFTDTTVDAWATIVDSRLDDLFAVVKTYDVSLDIQVSPY